MPVNIYETRTMMEAINQVKPARTFLKDTFFYKQETKLTAKVDVDIKKSKRKMAPFVSPRVGGVVITREGYETKSISTPKIAPERLLTLEDINLRNMGESIYSTKTPEQRSQETLASDLIELDECITRREEWMCRELLINGKIDVSEETENGTPIEKEINFQFSNKKTLSGEDLWSDAKSDPITKLKEARKEIIKKTGQNPDIIVMDSESAEAFINHKKVKDHFNILNMKYGVIEPSIQVDGTTFYGKIPELGCELYSYDEWFVNDEGDETAMIPRGTVIIAPKDLGKMIYGAVTQMEQQDFITYEGTRVPKIYADTKNECKNIRLTSRPVPVPFDVDSWCVMSVL